jgi:hypothetical protein
MYFKLTENYMGNLFTGVHHKEKFIMHQDRIFSLMYTLYKLGDNSVQECIADLSAESART